MKKITLLFALLTFTIFIFAQNKSSLSLTEIMKGDHFIGHVPERISWDDNSQDIYFSWNPADELLSSVYQTNLNGSTPRKLSLEERKQKNIRTGGDYNKTRTQKVFSKNGDLYWIDFANKKEKQITNTLAYEYNPIFSYDEKSIFFEMDNNAFAWSIADGSLRQLTNFQEGKEKKKDKKLSKQEQWLEDDQLEHFEILQLKEAQREAREAQREALKVDRPKPIYLDGKRLNDLEVSPDGKFVVYQLSKSANGKSTKVPDFVTKDGYLKDLRSRSKVGSPQTKYYSGIFDIEKDTFYMIDKKQIKGIYDKPDFLKDYVEKDSTFSPKYKKPREVIIHQPVFNEAGNQAVLVVRSQDNKDRWIMSLDLGTGKLKTLDRQRDEAWVGGPGIGGWNSWSGNIGWMKGDKMIWFQSEETGFSHLYCLNPKNGKKKQLTKGKFEILDAYLSNDKDHFYISSNKVSPAEQHFYKMKTSGGKLEQITTMEGNSQVTMSPDEKYLAIRYSYANQPWELYVMPNQAGATAKKITDSTTDKFKAYKWRVPELIKFKAADGVEVPARLYRPEGGSNGKPAVIFVHGAGYLQNVHKWWSTYKREYMFHNLLTDNGYTVLDIDYRASNGYGRDWRTAIYRHMGGKDLSDQVDGAKYLVDELGVDKNSIGIYGGSYGGFISIFAMFNHNDVFKCGAALRSVTDWAHYNHGYTSNILNTPVEDPIAFKKSAPIYFADNFNQGKLIMLHGMVDRNVQFQDVVRLSQRLIELEKKNWDVAIFPMEGHGFRESSSWADEYRRIFELFESELKN